MGISQCCIDSNQMHIRGTNRQSLQNLIPYTYDLQYYKIRLSDLLKLAYLQVLCMNLTVSDSIHHCLASTLAVFTLRLLYLWFCQVFFKSLITELKCHSVIIIIVVIITINSEFNVP